jgi:2,4-dienoyl-CoA reductase-like NADH-dependent reductase (Old Yellow Enzyme family)
VSAGSTHPALMAPIALGPVTLRNRVVSTSHQTSLVHDHLPTDDLVAYHAARAEGGAGAIFLEATATDPTGLLTAHTIGGFLPEVVPAYRRLADAVHAHGTKLLVQFNHGGREQISASPRTPTAAPSAIPSLRFKTEPRALTHSEISRLIEGYAISTRHAARGGLDGVELSISHGYLPAQFLSRQSNRRGDAWDGDDLAARLRFSTEVLTAMREAVGTQPMAVGARLSADELTPGGMTIEDCIEAVLRLHEQGLLDFVSLVHPRRCDRPPRRRRARRHTAGAPRAGYDARRGPRRRRAARLRRRRRSGGHDPRAHRRSRAHRQDAGRRRRRGHRLHRL